MKNLKIIILSLILMLFTLQPSFGGSTVENWTEASGKIEKLLNDSLKTYKSGKNDEGMEMVADAYFGHFEGAEANMEIAVRRFLSLKVAIKLEKSFTGIRKAMHKGEPIDKVNKQVIELIEGLKEAASKLDKKEVGLNVGFNNTQ